MKLKDRIYRYLNHANERGAFAHPHGELLGLDAYDIADGIAAEWDGRNRHRLLMVPGRSAHEPDSLERYIQDWLDSR